jgi:hypothetical protein
VLNDSLKLYNEFGFKSSLLNLSSFEFRIKSDEKLFLIIILFKLDIELGCVILLLLLKNVLSVGELLLVPPPPLML